MSTILRLVKTPPARIEGEIYYKGQNILDMPMRDFTRIRGKEISMIFQEPMTSLDPVIKIGPQIAESLMLHEKLLKNAAMAKALELLKQVEIPNAEKRINDYPHQLSGGMRQRVMIAMALACKPQILLADEPTTALDVTIQAQIMDLIKKLRGEYGMSIMIVTHDLGVISDVADRVVVFYSGQIVEEARTADLFKHPKHPSQRGCWHVYRPCRQKRSAYRLSKEISQIRQTAQAAVLSTQDAVMRRSGAGKRTRSCIHAETAIWRPAI